MAAEPRPYEPEDLLARLGSGPTSARRSWLILLLVTALLVTAGVLVLRRDPTTGPTDTPLQVVDRFLGAWSDLDLALMGEQLDESSNPTEAVFALGAVNSALDVRGVETRRLGPGQEVDGLLEVPVEVTLDLSGMDPWVFETTVPVSESDDGPGISWRTSILHPRLDGTTTLRRSAPRWADRAQILGTNGVEFYDERPAVIVGMIPTRVSDVEGLAEGIARYAPVDADTVRAIYEANVDVGDFVDVVVMERSSYTLVSEQLKDLPGAFFEPGINLDSFFARLPPASPFAADLLGTTGPAGSDDVTELGLPYAVGRPIGRRGVEQEYERRLAGRPDQAIELLDGDGVILEVLHDTEAIEPVGVTTSLDPDLQLIAEEVLTGIEQPTTLVAVDGQTGAVIAAATRPADGVERLLTAPRSPGNAFALVVAHALFSKGVSPDAPAQCSERLSVSDVAVTNEDGRVPSDGTLASALVRSCTTALVAVAAEELEPADLTAAAAELGIGLDSTLGLPAAIGSVATSDDPADMVRLLTGQAGVEVTPVEMASAAASIAAGRRIPTSFVTDPRPAGLDTEPVLLPDVAGGHLREAMRQAVASGTGSGAGIAGFDVGGLTGTQAGIDGPVAGWFVGFSEDVGIAVVVDGPARGGEVAAPLAGDFFRGLRQFRSAGS